MTSMRTLESAVSGPYRRANNAVIARRVPTVIEPSIARWPPIPYAKAVATAATLVMPTKKMRLSIAV